MKGGFGGGKGGATYENPGFPVSKPGVSQSQGCVLLAVERFSSKLFWGGFLLTIWECELTARACLLAIGVELLAVGKRV